MDVPTLTRFLMWSMILNSGLFAFWSLTILFAPDLAYRLQYRFFPLERKTWDVVMYAFMGAYKLLIVVFNLVPYVALLLVG